MSEYTERDLDYLANLDQLEHLDEVPEEDPWWDRFYDEGDCFEDYDGYRDEVER